MLQCVCLLTDSEEFCATKKLCQGYLIDSMLNDFGHHDIRYYDIWKPADTDRHRRMHEQTNERTNELIVQTIYRDTFNTTVSKQHFDRRHIEFKHTVKSQKQIDKRCQRKTKRPIKRLKKKTKSN